MSKLHPILRRLVEKRRDEQGFTLVELMVVVLIIGILVAIAIPVFLNAQNSAKSSGAKSDIKNAATEVKAALSATGSLPAAGTGSGQFTLLTANTSPPAGNLGIAVSKDTTIVTNYTISGATATMCLASGSRAYRATISATDQSVTYANFSGSNCSGTPSPGL